MSELRLFGDAQPDALFREGRAVGRGDVLLTAEQTIGVERRDGPLMLVAGAGAGKTTVLVERIVRHVLVDDVPLASILAITFTRKAAGELRGRVRERFLELGHPDHARDVDAAWISTIDGCCARILRAHAVVAGLDPAFEVLDDGQRRELRELAFARALDDFLVDPSGADRVDAALVLAGYGHDQLAEAIWKAYDALRSAGHAEPRVPVPAQVDPAPARAALDRAAADLAEELSGAAAGKSVDDAREAIAGCRAAIAEVDPADFDAALKQWRFARRGNALKTDAVAAYYDALERYERALSDVACLPALKLVAELLERAGTELAACKAERAALDFDDLALRTRDLLREHPGIAAAYAARLTRVLVDELQDTNQLQIDLIAALGQQHVFTVGDALQSIYGFRNADVDVFVAREAEQAAAGRSEQLASNFRSEPDILRVINAAFGPFLAHWRDLVPGRERQAPAPRVELLLSDATAWGAEPQDGGPSAELIDELGAGLPPFAPALHAEARLVAEHVASLVAAGEHRPGEIVVLLRAGVLLALYERALEQAGVPAVASQGRDWWARLEVQDLLCHLRVLINAGDEPALLTSLALAGADSDALALLRLAGPSLWRSLERVAAGSADGPLATIDSAQRELLVAQYALLVEERDAAARLGPGELLRRALARTGYAEAAAARPGGVRRVANVRKLVRLADAFEARRGRDVRGFVDHAQAELDAKAPTPDAPVEVGADAAVRLMTIHGAKGLEFGVVVVADLGRQPPTGFQRILVDPRDGRVGLSVLDVQRRRREAFDLAELKRERADRERAEGRRVMHVGVTRARDLLVLSGAAKLKGGVLADGSQSRTPIEWMATGLLGADCDLGSVEDELRTVGQGAEAAQLRVRVSRPGNVGRVLMRPAPQPADAAAGGEARGLAPRPAGASQAPPAFAGELSYTTLSDYARCPYSWYLRRVLGLPGRDGSDVAAAGDPGRSPRARLRGTLAHSLLEHADLRLAARDPAAADVEERARALDIELVEGDVDDQLALIAAFLRSPLRERAADGTAIRREATFAFALAGTAMLGGVIDLLVQEPGGRWLVVDYKSDHVEPGDDLDSRVAADYPIQRAAYALAALRAGAAAVEVVHFYLERPADPVSASYAPADAIALEELLLTASRGIREGAHPVAAEPHAGLCAECPGRGGLCSWPDAMTCRPAPAHPA